MRAPREARLLPAARLLEATGLPVARVAAASGFTSAPTSTGPSGSATGPRRARTAVVRPRPVVRTGRRRSAVPGRPPRAPAPDPNDRL
ncbi:hypothetical protein ACWD7F_04430 [Streptomyces sp. NPDC005122]